MESSNKEQSRKLKNQVHIRLSDEEYVALYKWKEWLGLTSANDVIRMFIRSGVGYYFDYSEHSNIAHEISKIGTNINQIAYRLNATNTLYSSDIEMLKMYLEHVEELVRNFIDSKENVLIRIGNEFIENSTEKGCEK